MQEILISTQTCSDELNVPHTFRYFLIAEQISVGLFTFEHYGVKVQESGGKSTSLHSITHSRTLIDALLALLVMHTVSPTSLYDIVEDWTKENHLPQLTPQQVVQMG